MLKSAKYIVYILATVTVYATGIGDQGAVDLGLTLWKAAEELIRTWRK